MGGVKTSSQTADNPVCAGLETDATSALLRLGPQVGREPRLLQRLRFHQSWFRSEVLQRPAYGSTPGPKGRALGSILSSMDAQLGLNFTSESARALFTARRQRGWGIDPVRCTSYLTSSQALTLNVFGPLTANLDWCRRFFAEVLGRSDIERVAEIHVEWAPDRPSEFLGDKTRVDVLVELQTETGRQFVVVEVKYADRFDSRQVAITSEPYRRLADARGLWADVDMFDLQANCNQLTRCDALGMAWAASKQGVVLPPLVLVVHHQSDQRAMKAVAEYRLRLVTPHRVQALTLEVALAIMRSTAEDQSQRSIAHGVLLRYGSDSLSEPLWRELRARAQMRRDRRCDPI